MGNGLSSRTKSNVYKGSYFIPVWLRNPKKTLQLKCLAHNYIHEYLNMNKCFYCMSTKAQEMIPREILSIILAYKPAEMTQSHSSDYADRRYALSGRKTACYNMKTTLSRDLRC